MATPSPVDELLQALTLEEKVALLSGADMWQTQDIPRLGIGSLKTTDGPSGARGHFSVDGPKAAFIPGPVCQAATWSKRSLRSLGQLLCREAKTKSAQILLAPTICCARNPLGGRNFECFGEDPFLSGSLAIEYVAGVQESGEVVATPKHFVGNEQEHHRFTIDNRMGEKALREIYLKPFEMVVRSASPPGCLMSSYNLVNDWAFSGVVMSDWGGVNSTADSVSAGCDLEMSGPAEFRGEKLLRALRSPGSTGLQKAIESSARRVLELARVLNKVGLTPEEAAASRRQTETSSTSKEDLALMRGVTASGIVLLKNDHDILPLQLSNSNKYKVAFIGPNALKGTPGGGGSASMNPQYLSQPMDAFKQVTAELNLDIQVSYAPGAHSHKWLPLFSAHQFKARETDYDSACKSLVRIDFYASTDLSGSVIETQHRDSSYIHLLDTSPAAFQGNPVPPYSFRVSTTLHTLTAGSHSFSVASIGGARLFVDGKLVIDNSNWAKKGENFYGFASKEVTTAIDLSADTHYQIVVEGWIRTDGLSEENHAFAPHPSLRIGYLEQLSDNMIADAVALANESDYSIVVLGLDDEWESEGYDRLSMAQPGNQDRLAQALLSQSARPERLIFVHQSGSPVELPWIDDAGTFVQAWYGGQEAGNALADIIMGKVNPSGRMPISWPRMYTDLPFASDKGTWGGIDDVAIYKEDTQVGYRYFLAQDLTPLFWFGQGLSYTTFSRSITSVATHAHSWTVTVSVTNEGAISGCEVVQLYVWLENEPTSRTLKAFDKTESLRPNETVDVVLTVQHRDLSGWAEDKWTLRRGTYFLGVGQGVGDVHMQTTAVNVDATKTWLASEY